MSSDRVNTNQTNNQNANDIPAGSNKAGSRHTLSVHVDRWEKSSSEISITGWAYSALGETTIRVCDAGQRELPAIVRRSRRIDIDRLFSISGRQDTGFQVYVTREDAADLKKLFVVFSDAKEEQMYRIDLQNERKAAVRTLPVSEWLKPATWAKGFRYVFNNGGLAALRRGRQTETEQTRYDTWFKEHRVTEQMLQRQRVEPFAYAPKISITIPLFNTKLQYLDVLLESITEQSYVNWELCLADGSTQDDVERHLRRKYQLELRSISDEPAQEAAVLSQPLRQAETASDSSEEAILTNPDGRIRYRRLRKNEGISGNTNAALKMATGDYILLSDHDDIIEKDALFEIVRLLNDDPSLDIIYTDEDLTDEAGEHFRSPRFKPDFSIDLLRSINYICHLFCIRRTVMDEVGGFRSDCDGAQDWDLFLRCSEKTNRIGHVPKVLYHWRESESSTARNPESKTYAIASAKAALEGHYKRCGLQAELLYTDIFILYHAKLSVKDNPKVSIIIPNKDNRDVLDKCIQSIVSQSTYRNLELIVVENNSTDPETFRYYRRLKKQFESVPQMTLRLLRYEGTFNYSKINNFGAAHATGDYLLLLNNDTEVITPDWIEQMLGYCQREDVGAVGAKLLYPDETVQHCGVVVGLGGFAGHILTGKLREDAGYMGRLRAIHDVSAVTGACLMTKKSLYDKLGGLDEKLTVALNDIDYCLKVRGTGALIVQNPGAELFHYESKSRRYEETPEKHERFKKEIRYFREKWDDVLAAGDPYYNPNMTLMYGDCRLRGENEHFDIIDEIEAERAAEG